MCKVSVIVPVYNKSQYLKECLDSLLEQTLEDIEIICIDDNSTDNSLEIINDYIIKDSRVSVIINETNKGVSTSRNSGIGNASGEYIAFVDADDIVEPMFYEKLYNASNGYECVKGEIWDYDPEYNECSINQLQNTNDKIKHSNNPAYFYYGFTSAIYQRELINRYSLRFPEWLSYYEDIFFTVKVISKLRSIKVVDNARYFYRNVETSLSHNVGNAEIADFVKANIDLFSYLKSCDLDYDGKRIILNNLLSVIGNYIYDNKLSAFDVHNIENEYLTTFPNNKEIKDIKVSVIVPVYNGGKYLHRTLGYLLFQTLFDIEIICVDDNSTDNSLDILYEYAERDDRIRIIRCDVNGGESKARNIGLKAARGQYVAFMDQDDRIDSLFYDSLYKTAIYNDADIAKGNSVDIFYDNKIYQSHKAPVKKSPLYFFGNWWTGIFRRSLLMDNKLEFPEGCLLGGDLKFQFDVCRIANKVSTDYSVCYYHLMHEDSGDSVKTPIDKVKSLLSVNKYILEEIEKGGYVHTNPEIYNYYYSNCLRHLSDRILKCEKLEGKLLCCEFIFEYYKKCECREYLLELFKKSNTLLCRALKENDKEFYQKVLSDDSLNDIFHSRCEHRPKRSIKCSVVVPYINEACISKYIKENKFIQDEKELSISLVDNSKDNKPISFCYNRFLDNYDYAEDAWIIFMHSDFELLEYPSNVLENLDKTKIYGPVGMKAYFDNDRVGFISKGSVFEKDSDNNLYENFQCRSDELTVDTLDCMCLIIHSSLINEFNLRFDENLKFDLYVEDFCINAKTLHGIESKAVRFNCIHHSSVISQKFYKEEYIDQLKYLNAKYPNAIFGGIITPIGGRKMPEMTKQELDMFCIRHELMTGEKL